MNEIQIDTYRKIYNYHMKFFTPYFYFVDYNTWKESLENDIDGEGRKLFKKLYLKTIVENNEIIGFIQYGFTNFGFNEQGEISYDISYCVIRNFYFNENRLDIGQTLLNEALNTFKNEKIYAFFHYFVMSCFARHGKLCKIHKHIEDMLLSNEFEIEHENVYYSSKLTENRKENVKLELKELTIGNQQCINFIIDNNQVGGCEIHIVNDNIVYLRWIYINGNIVGKGIGSICMSVLKSWLYSIGFNKLDTDTAINNVIAQHYYEKNQFNKLGITRSYFKK